MDWNEIVADLGPRLFRYFRARFSVEEADDLTQETLVRLVRKARAGAFDPERGRLDLYAFGIAHFVTREAQRTMIRAREVAQEPQILDQAQPSETTDEARPGAEEIRAAIRFLPADQVEILALMLDQELTLKAIGQILSMPLGTVKSHVFRAKENLRQHFLRRDKNL